MKCKVYLSSKPGPWEQYAGTVTVEADSLAQAERLAVSKLASGTFKDRGDRAWRIGKVEVEL